MPGIMPWCPSQLCRRRDRLSRGLQGATDQSAATAAAQQAVQQQALAMQNQLSQMAAAQQAVQQQHAQAVQQAAAQQMAQQQAQQIKQGQQQAAHQAQSVIAQIHQALAQQTAVQQALQQAIQQQQQTAVTPTTQQQQQQSKNRNLSDDDLAAAIEALERKDDMDGEFPRHVSHEETRLVIKDLDTGKLASIALDITPHRVESTDNTPPPAIPRQAGHKNYYPRGRRVNPSNQPTKVTISGPRSSAGRRWQPGGRRRS